MTQSETRRFLAQFAQARKRMAKWPRWMREAARIASATFPVEQSK